MTVEIPKCPTCGRRPSERYGLHNYPKRVAMSPKPCTDPIHDAADLGPAAVALLRESRKADYLPSRAQWERWTKEFTPRLDAFLASLPEVRRG